jgi:hypothetical protein
MAAFWFAIIAGLAGAFLGLKKGSFYALWAILFNVAVSIYLGLTIARFVIEIAEWNTTENAYNLAISVLLIAGLIFALLQVIAINFFTKYELPFPGIFDTAGSAVLGFLVGFLVCCFMMFIVCVMPFSRAPAMKLLNGPQGPPSRMVIKPIGAVCDVVADFSLQRYTGIGDDLVKFIISVNEVQPPDEAQLETPYSQE